MSARARRVLWTTSLAHGSIHVYELAVPALLLPIQREFGAGDLAMGQVVMLYGFMFGAGALPAGWLIDRFGSKSLLMICLWGAAGSLVGMALSPSLGAFAAWAALMGACLSIYHPAGTALLTHAVADSGRVFATHGMAGNLGVAGAAVLAGTLGTLVGWRAALCVLAGAGALLALAVIPLEVPSATDIRARPGDGDRRGFALLLIAVTFVGIVYRGLTTFLPKFFALRLGGATDDAPARGGALTTAALLVGLAGMYLAGRLVDAGVRPSRVFLAGALLQAPFLVALGWAGGLALVPLAMGVAFFHFLTQPPGNQMVSRFTPPRLRGFAYGIYFFLTFGVGSIGAVVGGWVSEQRDLARAFPVLAVALIPAVAATLVLALRSPALPRADGSRGDR